MARTPATPESRRDSYGTKGRPLSDWQALKELWNGSASVRAACNDGFTRFEKHAYAQPATQRDAEGRELTELIWAEMRASGYDVSPPPVHFTKAMSAPQKPAATATPADAGPANEPPLGSDDRIHRPPPPPVPGSPRIAPILVIVAVVVVIVLVRRRRRRI
jgi:hypothetical protein